MLVVFCEPCAGCTGTGARGKCAFHRAGSGKWKVFPHLRRVAPQARDPTPGAPPWPPRAHKTSTCRPSARRASGHVACSSIRRHARQLQYDVRDRGRHPGDAPAVPARGALLIPAARAGGDARRAPKAPSCRHATVAARPRRDERRAPGAWCGAVANDRSACAGGYLIHHLDAQSIRGESEWHRARRPLQTGASGVPRCCLGLPDPGHYASPSACSGNRTCPAHRSGAHRTAPRRSATEAHDPGGGAAAVRQLPPLLHGARQTLRAELKLRAGGHDPWDCMQATSHRAGRGDELRDGGVLVAALLDRVGSQHVDLEPRWDGDRDAARRGAERREHVLEVPMVGPGTRRLRDTPCRPVDRRGGDRTTQIMSRRTACHPPSPTSGLAGSGPPASGPAPSTSSVLSKRALCLCGSFATTAK